MLNPEIFFQALVNGLLMGTVYGIAAVGLSLIWGVLGVVNLAHGSLIILSAYLTYWVFSYTGVPPLTMIPVSIFLGFLVGYMLYSAVGPRVVSLDPSTSVLFFFGLSLLLSNTILNLWGPDVRGIPWLIQSIEIFGIRVSFARLIALLTTVICFITLYVLIQRTYVGKAIRAVVINRVGALSIGINVHQIFALSMGIGIGITFFSGTMIALVNPFTPVSGEGYLMYSFASVVLGGIGNIIGTLLAGIFMGVVESFIGVYFSQSISPAAAFIILVLVILVRYRGQK
ncbi:MAG: branched-chain amino acid ABC transporter permease [Candidatus Caldarchaeum sp.]|uniref:Branched-chain amino acid ABC transporter permease n=1 Tax=Caldiarchaeum subterraneum TaxID=311458 RepID=A0A7C5Y658_CALS0